jgi:hypothetical protein
MKLLTSYHRGHEIIYDGDVWRYSDTGQAVNKNPDCECGHCGKANTPEGHDGCLGTPPGVKNACCGHGREYEAYIQFDDDTIVRGKEAILKQESLK